jgi:hypothetical protein
MGTIYSLLYAAHVDVILNGHDHDYERFAPLDPNGDVDPANGIREFVVGTGGRNLTTFVGVHPGSEVRRSDTFGLLRLVLHPTSYRWQFVPAAGGTFADSGSQPCHIAAGADHTPPGPPPALRATAVLSNRIDLAWQPASDDVGVVAYRIYRNGSPLTTVGNIHGFADTGAQPGTPYTYTVSALDASGNESAQSPVASVTTPAAEATPPLFVDGFETGTLDQWTDAAGNVQPSTSAASGKYAARLVANGAPTLAYRQFSPAVDDLWLRARFEVASQSTQADLFRLRTFGAKAGQSFGVLTLFVTPAGRLGYRIEPTGATVVSQTTVATGVWHTLLLHVHLGDLPSAGAVDTTLDGSPVPELTGPAAVQSPAIGRVQIGSSVPAQTFDASFDDVVASTVQP